ncbi:hypothetical protein ACRALDRAFT_2122599 [Sodiomyces alcalophilus JCM 7366]|uniref:uncharacterized protein n=1 Tax=Sodiomyces alcalophilus JCM 7366 TaxID=591952 RepID=UPI0039B558BC
MSQQHEQEQCDGGSTRLRGESVHSHDSTSSEGLRAKKAATVIQRTYRGYRSRREMEGLGLDSSTRWVAAIQEAQFRETTKPRPKHDTGASDEDAHCPLSRVGTAGSTARKNWKKAAVIARRAGHDDPDSDDSSSLSATHSDAADETGEERAERRRQRKEAIAKRKREAKMMGLQYFLEMVDYKHRYGSNLRAYHEEWKKSDTNENFFYWLDYGEGRYIDMVVCPRDRLERERVRYLSREERQYYLVTVDSEGRLCWAKNGALINTSEDDYRDSIHGIVPRDDPTPSWPESAGPGWTLGSEDGDADEGGSATSRSTSSMESAREADRAAKYAIPEYDQAKGPRKVAHLSVGTVFDKLLRKSVRKNTWIFVADTSFRVYVGIKDSGVFQHSSFLQGGRISAAGLIQVEDGRLKSLAPLSGHYRPTSSSFRAFIRSLRDTGVDMSQVTISKTYAVLVGLEAYVKTRSRGRQTFEKLMGGKEKEVPEQERDGGEGVEEKKEGEEAAVEARETRGMTRWLEKMRVTSARNDAESGGG